MTIPLLLRPRVIGWKNHLFRGNLLPRSITVVVLSSIIMSIVYSGSIRLFNDMMTPEKTFLVHPTRLLSIFFTMLMFMVLLATSISSISCLYLSKDLDRLIASPIRTRTFFIGKGLESFQSTSWMVIVFAIPCLVAFTNSFAFSPIETAATLLLFLLIVALPTIWSMGFAILFAWLFPLHQVRRLLLFLAILAIGCIYLFVHIIGGAAPETERGATLAFVVRHLEHPGFHYLPSHWAAAIAGEFVAASGISIGSYCIALLSLFAGSFSFAYFLLKKFYRETYSANIQLKRTVIIQSKAAQRRFAKAFFFLTPSTRTLVSKELKLFSRDMSQTLQLVMLIGLCAIYLYNFGTVSLLAESSDADTALWQPVLLCINAVMGSFVVTAVCSRFVFPSVSMEGNAFWLLLSAPIRMEKIVSIKFVIWYLPIALISAVVLCSGALAVQAPLPLLLATLAFALVSSYGIVGLAIGLGALFANFEWEHISQLSASLGGLLYMAISMFLVFLSLFPFSLLLILYFAFENGFMTDVTYYRVALISTTVLLMYLNFLVQRWAIAAGVNALTRRCSE